VVPCRVRRCLRSRGLDSVRAVGRERADCRSRGPGESLRADARGAPAHAGDGRSGRRCGADHRGHADAQLLAPGRCCSDDRGGDRDRERGGGAARRPSPPRSEPRAAGTVRCELPFRYRRHRGGTGAGRRHRLHPSRSPLRPGRRRDLACRHRHRRADPYWHRPSDVLGATLLACACRATATGLLAPAGVRRLRTLLPLALAAAGALLASTREDSVTRPLVFAVVALGCATLLWITATGMTVRIAPQRDRSLRPSASSRRRARLTRGPS
jgi:hypothetical protein